MDVDLASERWAKVEQFRRAGGAGGAVDTTPSNEPGGENANCGGAWPPDPFLGYDSPSRARERDKDRESDCDAVQLVPIPEVKVRPPELTARAARVSDAEGGTRVREKEEAQAVDKLVLGGTTRALVAVPTPNGPDAARRWL